MKMNSSSLLFSLSFVVGTLITISSSSWLGVWMGLELNLLSFLPLMLGPSKFSAEAALKYFLIQALASALLLVGVLACVIGPWPSPGQLAVPSGLMMFALFTKMGAAPTHFWFPEVSSGLSWVMNMILMTWQKIAPFILLFYILVPGKLLMAVSGASALVGALGGFNQTSLRKILAFSSINHMAWMLVAASASQNLWIIYFVTYSLMTLVMMSFFNFNNLNILPQLNLSLKPYSLPNLLMALNMLSMGGLPPFLGFMPKWMVMEYMMSTSLYGLALFMVIMTLIVLYFYLRLTYTAFMFYNSSLKITPQEENLSPNVLTWVSLTGLLVGPVMLLM